MTENGGNLTLTNSTVTGPVAINGGTFSIGPGSNISGPVTITGLSGSSPNQVCDTHVSGPVTLQGNTAPIVFGNSAACAGNTVSGPVTVDNNASVQVFYNTISGNLTCQGNTSITGGGNTAPAKQGQCATF